MVTIAEEEPFVAVVDEKKLDTVCSNCFAVKGELNKIDLKRCDECQVVNYCSKKCQEEDWKFHEDECQFLRKSDERATVHRLMSRFIMRVRRGDLPVAFNGRTFDDLMDHKDEIEKDVDRYDKMNEEYRELLIFMGRDNAPSFKEFSSFYGKRIINCFGITYTGVLETYLCLGEGVYLGVAAHNHSCRPTAEYHFNGSKIVLIAKDPNGKYSKSLTLSYIPNITTRDYRQERLRSRYYFDCDCDRCMDEETELLERSGRSPCCPTEGAVLPIHKKFLWYWEQPLVCTNCGKQVDTELEKLIENDRLTYELCAMEDNLLAGVHCRADVHKLVQLLHGAELFLSPYNIHLMEFTDLVKRAAAIVDRISPLFWKYMSARKKVQEKYSIDRTTDDIEFVLETLKSKCLENCNKPREIAFAKFDAACQKALDVVKEAYGSDHSLCKEITEFSGLNKFLYDRVTAEREEKTEEKMGAEEENKKTTEEENGY